MSRPVRFLIFLLAVLALLVLFVGGGYLVWKHLQSGPSISFDSLPVPKGGGIEKKLIGLYLDFRKGEIETPVSPNGESVAFTVEPGQTAGDISARLKDAGLISDASLFRLLVGYYDLGNRLEAGEYVLSPAMSMMEIVEELQHGRLTETTITIPEGWRLEEIGTYLQKQGITTAPEFLQIAREGPFAFGFLQSRPAGASLEGYLFPDTYRIGPSFAARDVILLMLQTFDKRLTPEMRAQIDQSDMTLHQILTLAAIVEREAVIPEERPVIAKVYLNRLDVGMYLNADPTVQYAMGYSEATGKWWNPLTAEDYQSVVSDYNTYTHLGLPPGPVCNPGIDSIRAVLYPADVDYLYFVRNDVKGDGSHVFSRTFEEHLENQAKYRR